MGIINKTTEKPCDMGESLNFGAGPAKLPREVLLEVQKEIISYGGLNMSIMEMSHRSPEYLKVNNDAQQAIRDLLNVPDNFKILFLQGGGSGMFAAVALNLLGITGEADYLVTGTWSNKAAKEAEKYGKVNLIFPKTDKYQDIPDRNTWKLSPTASYVYYCANETVDGVEYQTIPETDKMLVADMSSNFMTRPIDWSKYGCVFGGAQKNVGPAGNTIVVIRDDLLGKALPICPSIWNFQLQAKDNSVYNTPSVFAVYVMEKVFQWIKRNGGIKEMERQAIEKSNLLYQVMEESNGFYTCPIKPRARSRMNVPFRVGGPNGDEALEKLFLKESESMSMYQLKGHRSVGGIRASLYNAVQLDDVKVLVKFMREFQKKYSN